MSRPRWGVTGVFALSGVCCALWSAALPTLIGHLHLSPGRMGTVLLLGGLGSILVMPLAGRLCDRLSSRAVVTVCAPVAALCLLAPATAGGYPALLAAGLLVGAGLGALDVSMNAQAVVVETAEGRPLMSGFHGVWSLGAVAGGAAVAAGLAAGLDLRVLLGAAGALCAVMFAGPLLLIRLPAGAAVAGGSGVAAVGSGATGHAEPSASRAAGRPPLASGLILMLGLLAMAGFITEGAGYSWAVLHATRDVHASPATASLVYAVFAAALTCSRLVGDRVRARLGSRRGIALAGATASAGYVLVLLASHLRTGGLAVEFAGWAVVGVGLATVVPTLFSAAGSGGEVGRALSRVTTLAYVGALAGPGLVGLLADRTSLTTALLLPAALALAIGLLGPSVVGRAAGDGPSPADHASTAQPTGTADLANTGPASTGPASTSPASTSPASTSPMSTDPASAAASPPVATSGP
ncbi:MFS transporter [Planotetraspora sp. A-T 1434]|uniref:MFS transporter n=1 Tax=Planotetraspora sp. A-T 1434 TaxID=2979219 RepID=UPI0021BFA09B|nr:MFS transporter [Planotetraspora sp. A-T 1434]MCT9932259.1 MFS transporter [Planotetraspora sp. A-T 1434]